MGPLRGGLLLLLFVSPVSAQQFIYTSPPGSPTHPCTFTPQSDPATLRVFEGDAVIPFVFACGVRTPGKCVTQELKPGTKDIPQTSFLEYSHQENGWACVSFGGIDGWVPYDRLAPLPRQPLVPMEDWMGWYRKTQQVPGKRNDRLLLSRGKAPGRVRVSGRGYWYGAGDDVHFGKVTGEGTAVSRYLHIVDGDDENACVLNLTLDPKNHTLFGDDNQKCGGMNVRFSGKWVRVAAPRR